MKRIALMAGLLAISVSAIGQDFLETIETEVFKTNGTPSEIISRAKACMAEKLRNDNPGSSAAQGLFSYVGDDKLIANARFEYNYLLIRRSILAKYIFEAKEGRFRITTTDILYKQVKDTTGFGFGASVDSVSGHGRLAKVWGTGYEEAESQILALDNKIAECVMNEKKSNW